MPRKPSIDFEAKSSKAFINRELSWLAFARRVLSMAQREDIPLLERVKFAGIVGTLHDEFFMKRMSGLKRQIRKGSTKLSLDGLTPAEEYDACRKELLDQTETLDAVAREDLRGGLREQGLPILDHADLDKKQMAGLRDYFRGSVMPILTPLAVDAEHPFPFISNLGLNVAALLPQRGKQSFVRIKVPNNRPRWVPIPGGGGFVPLEQVIAANLDLLFPATPPKKVHVFRVTRGAEGDSERGDDTQREPGSIVRQVSVELKARRFAGVVRLQVDASMPDKLRKWLTRQLGIGPDAVYRTDTWLGLSDLMEFEIPDRRDLYAPAYEPGTHARLRTLDPDPGAIFDEIDRGDILLHHPYDSFDTSVLRFIRSASVDPQVLAIKLTIYRTSSESPIVQALADAARRGKQVAVLVEITARFDEAPNIAWGKYLEREGVHVAYGVERLKTHVKAALVVREIEGRIRRYAHVGTGNYHARTARLYEDVGLLTSDEATCEEVAAIFNELTGAVTYTRYDKLLVAPRFMRQRFTGLIRREAAHAKAGRPCGIDAKMNQLQDPDIIRELYRADLAGVPIRLNIRGLCCLRPGVPGLSERTRVFGVVGRFLEHSRIYHFENGGDAEFFIGSADWMKRNLNSRIETVLTITDPAAKARLQSILDAYDRDNCSVWDCKHDGTYVRRQPQPGEEVLSVQDEFARASEAAGSPPDPSPPAGEGRDEQSASARAKKNGHARARGTNRARKARAEP